MNAAEPATWTAADGYALLGALLLVLAAALFGAAETALSRMSLPRAQRLLDDERPGAARVVRLLEDPARTLNNLALLVLALNVVAVVLITVVVDRFLSRGAAVPIASVIVVAALFVGAEVAPRTLAVQRTDEVALHTARWVLLFVRPLAPLGALLIWAGNVIAPGKGLKQGPFVTEDEIREMIDVAESDEIIEESERAMIHSIFELGDTVVREIMVPRPDMVMVSDDATLAEVVDTILRAGHSRLPVYAGDRDRIVGLVYAKDVLGRLHDSGEDGPWHDLLRRPHFVPELKPVDALLRELQAEKVHLAVVIDEYGATVGIVTIEDILEEIVGEIVDEYDREEVLVEELAADAWRLDARLPVDELNTLLGTDLPDVEWDSVGGLLFGLLGHVPDPGEQVEVEGIRLTAERVQDRRIAKVLVRRLPVPAP
jgi:CBS domain containing-hemolysin-like protein